jgi:RimJ/RimL family protein N-acetyltransferase
MSTLLYGFDEQLARWACDRIPWADYQPNMRAVGVADGPGAADKLLAVCIFHNYAPPKVINGKTWHGTCEISMAAASPRWATRTTIKNLLRIPFLQYGCRKVFTVIPSSNIRAIEFNKGIGLKLEGSPRHHFAKGVHACLFGLMKSEFEHPDFLARKRSAPESRPHGQQQEFSRTASA